MRNRIGADGRVSRLRGHAGTPWNKFSNASSSRLKRVMFTILHPELAIQKVAAHAAYGRREIAARSAMQRPRCANPASEAGFVFPDA